jgi:NADH dehydrogenase
VIWSAGVRPSPLIGDIGTERLPRDDRLPTDAYLRVRGHERLWAIGDAAAIPNGSTGNLMPPTAQHAVREGRHVASNVYRAMSGKSLRPFRYNSIGMLATLGRYRGAGRVFGIPLVGFPAWFAWRTYYLLALPRWERRFRVVIDWTLNLVFPPDIVQIKVERLHPETGADMGVTRRLGEGRRIESASPARSAASEIETGPLA